MPEAIGQWLASGDATPLELAGPAGRLRARRFVEPGAHGMTLLVLEEEPSETPSLEPLARLGLTSREAEVLYWIAQGKTNPEIAIVLDSATNTVKKQAQNVLDKLSVETRTAAARIALEALGLVG